jgi:hypothetical protein
MAQLSASTVPRGAVHQSPSPFEVAEIVRAYGEAFRATHPVSHEQGRVLRAIAHCRTAALGGHVEVRAACGMERICYDSCRNRHCPKCQGSARAKWLAPGEACSRSLLPSSSPPPCAILIQVNQRALSPLVQTAMPTLGVGRDPQHQGGTRCTAVLHT